MDLPEHVRDLNRYKTPVKDVAPTKRKQLLNEFFARLNTPEAIAKYGAMSRGFVGKLLQKKTNSALDALLKDCKAARSFGGMFWTKVRRRDMLARK